MYLKPYAIMGRDRLDTGGRKGRGALLTTLLSGGTFTQCLRKTKVFILAGVGKWDLVNDVAPAFVSFTSLGVTVSNPDDFCAWVTTYQPSWLEKPWSTISSSSSSSPHLGGFSAVTPPPVSSPVSPLNDAFLPSSDPAEYERDRSADQGLGNSIPIPNRILDKLDPPALPPIAKQVAPPGGVVPRPTTPNPAVAEGGGGGGSGSTRATGLVDFNASKNGSLSPCSFAAAGLLEAIGWRWFRVRRA